MATGKVIGQIQVSVGNVKIIGLDGVVREPAYDGLVYEGEQIISVDPDALFQVKYSALPEATAYDGVFRVLTDGSVIAGIDAMDSIMSDQNLMDIFDLETAAGEEEVSGSSNFTPSDIVADSTVQEFGRGPKAAVVGLDGIEIDATMEDLNDFAPTAEDAFNAAMEDNPNNVVGRLVGGDGDGNPFHFVLVDGPSEGSVILLPDGRYIYNVGDDFQDLGVGETRDVTFTYKTVETYTPEGFESEVATVTITVAGTNDQPEIEDINVNGESIMGMLLTQTHTIDEEANTIGYSYFEVLEDGTVVTITTDGPTIDPMLYLFHADGNITADDYITHNDDGHTPAGSYYNSIITWTLPAGNYIAIVSDYRLNIDEIVAGFNDISDIASYTGDVTLTFTSSHDIRLYDSNAGARIIYETHDTDGGEDGDTVDDGNNVLTGALSVYDVDTNDTHTFEVVEGSVAISDPANAGVTADDVTVSIHQVGDEWQYRIDGNFTELAVGETATLTFDYVAIDDSGVGIFPVNPFDESDTSEPATVTLTITGTNDQPIVYDVRAEEVNEVLRGKNMNVFDSNLLLVTDDDFNDTHTFHLVDDEQIGGDHEQIEGSGGNSGWIWATVTDDSGVDLEISAKVKMIDEDTGAFKINGNFNALADGERATVTFYYYAVDNNEMEADGLNETSTSEPKMVTVIVIGTNDQPKVHNVHVEPVNEALDGQTSIISEFDDVRDRDVTDTHEFRVVDVPEQADIHDNEDWQELEIKVFTRDSDGNQTMSTASIMVNTHGDVDVDELSFRGMLVDNQTGTFRLDGDFNALAVDEKLDIKVRYVAVDDSGVGTDPEVGESDTSNSRWIMMRVEGTNDQPVVKDVSVVVSEESLLGHEDQLEIPEDFRYVGSVAEKVSDDDLSDDHTFAIDEGTLTMSITSTNQAFLSLFELENLEDLAEYINDEIGEYGIDMSVVNEDIEDPPVADSVTLTLSEEVIEFLQDHNIISVEMEDDGTYTVDSPLFNILGAHGSITLSFDYRATDSAGIDGYDPINELSESEASTVELTVLGTNDQPVAYANNYRALESSLDDTTQGGVNALFSANLPGSATGSILGDIFTRSGMDEDIFDRATLKFYLDDEQSITTRVAEGTQELQHDGIVVVDQSQTVVKVNGDGSFTVFNPTFDSLAVGESAVVTFQYYVDDESGAVPTRDNVHESTRSEPVTVNVTVLGTNDRPVLVSVSTNTSLMETDLVGLPFGDPDLPENSYIIGQLTPEITDDDVNDTHQFVAFGITVIPSEDIVDVNGVLDGSITKVRMDSEGEYRVFNPSFNGLGVGEEVTISFDVQVTDGTHGPGEWAVSNTQTVSLTISGTNDRPTVSHVEMNTLEATPGVGTITVLGTFLGHDEDVNDELTYRAISMHPNARVGDIIDRVEGEEGAGDGYVRLVVGYDADGNGVYEGRVAIAVKLPTGIDLDDINIEGISVYNNRGDGDKFTLKGDFDALSNRSELGIKFLYNATDDSGAIVNPTDESSVSAVNMVTITVNGTNDAPVANVDVAMTFENIPLIVDVLANDTDPDVGAVFTLDSITETSLSDGQISHVLNINNQLVFFPGTDFDYLALGETTEVIVRYTMSDEWGSQSSSGAIITVIGTNDAPVAELESITKIADTINDSHFNTDVTVAAITMPTTEEAELTQQEHNDHIYYGVRDYEQGSGLPLVDNHGEITEGVSFTFDEIMSRAKISFWNANDSLNGNDEIGIKLYLDGVEVGSVDTSTFTTPQSGGHSEFLINVGIDFDEIQVTALGNHLPGGDDNPPTEFRVAFFGSFTAPTNTLLPFVIDDSMLLANDMDVDGPDDALRIELVDNVLRDAGGDLIGTVEIITDSGSDDYGDIQVTPNAGIFFDTNAPAFANFAYVVVDEDGGISAPVLATIDVAIGTVVTTAGPSDSGPVIVDGTVSYDPATSDGIDDDFIIGTDENDAGAFDDNILIIDSTLDLSNVSEINTVELTHESASVTGVSDLGINPSDVMGSTDVDNILIIHSSDGDASNQVSVDESLFGTSSQYVGGTTSGLGADGIVYDFYSSGDATLLVQVDDPIDAPVT